MVTVVDGVNFLLDYQAAESLASRGETLGEDDERSITDLLIEQIEFADVILISKIDLISQHDREELIAIVQRLNAQAQILPMVMGQVPLGRILDTGLFRLRTRRPGPWLATGTAWRARARNRGIWHRLDRLPSTPAVSSRALLQFHRPSLA
nr:hypothetical protein GCM10020185_34080 [Pseudomonas brassicacearum subsp. brassicacearum]